jgi:hypothetical protein
MSNPVIVQRNLNRQLRTTAKTQAVKAFQITYAQVVSDEANQSLSEDELSVLAVVESIAAFNASYKATRNNVGQSNQVTSESVAA